MQNNRLIKFLYYYSTILSIYIFIIPLFRINIRYCNKLYAETTDDLSIFHPEIRNKKILIYKDKELLVDDILYGYDLLFEKTARYAATSWLGV